MAALNFSFPTSFTDLLASDDYPIINTGATTGTTVTKGLSDRIAERTGSQGLPKFKSFPPPSLPVSPPPVSPSSYFAFPPGLSPTMLLDSPVLLYGSNILPSPTTGIGSIFAEAFNWKNDSGSFNQAVKEEDKYQSNFSLDSQPSISESLPTNIPVEQKDQYWNMQDFNNQDGFFTEKNTAKTDYNYDQQTFSPEIASLENNSQPNSRLQPSNNHYKQSSQTVSEKKRSEDGYNWRKYGQKQVRGSENPRSYYKCTYPNCPTRKKLERSIEGHITEIVYTGNHNHPKPQPTKRSSSSSNSSVVLHPYNNVQAINDTIQDSATDNSSVSLGDGDFAQSPEKSISFGEEFDNEEPQAKRWKRENQNECISALASKTVREARVVVQTTSDIDILDDGYRWRKYGQKAVKGNPNPRSYYKCTSSGCLVRKHVERSSEDLRSVMTTYEGKHNHDVPAPRGSGNSHSLIKPVPSNLNDNRRTGNQVPYTLQMLQSPEVYGFATL